MQKKIITTTFSKSDLQKLLAQNVQGPNAHIIIRNIIVHLEHTDRGMEAVLKACLGMDFEIGYETGTHVFVDNTFLPTWRMNMEALDSIHSSSDEVDERIRHNTKDKTRCLIIDVDETKVSPIEVKFYYIHKTDNNIEESTFHIKPENILSGADYSW